MSGRPARDSRLRLQALDAAVDAALASGDESGLLVLGYGEISLVLGWPVEEPRFACKRLPLFPNRAASTAYRAHLARLPRRVRAAGVRVVDTDLRPVERADGTVAGYVVQPILPAAAWPRPSWPARTRPDTRSSTAVCDDGRRARAAATWGSTRSLPTGPGESRRAHLYRRDRPR